MTYEIISLTPHHTELYELLQHYQLMSDKLEKQNARYFGIIQDQKLVAAASIELYFDSALLSSIAVSNPHQKKGYGKALLNHSTELGKKHDKEHFYLITDKAKSFFEKQGFSHIHHAKAPHSIRNSSQFTKTDPDKSSLMYMSLT